MLSGQIDERVTEVSTAAGMYIEIIYISQRPSAILTLCWEVLFSGGFSDH